MTFNAHMWTPISFFTPSCPHCQADVSRLLYVYSVSVVWSVATMAHKKKHLLRGAIIDYDDGHEWNFGLSTVFSAATNIMMTSYSQVPNKESRQPIHAPPVPVAQTEPNVSPEAEFADAIARVHPSWWKSSQNTWVSCKPPFSIQKQMTMLDSFAHVPKKQLFTAVLTAPCLMSCVTHVSLNHILATPFTASRSGMGPFLIVFLCLNLGIVAKPVPTIFQDPLAVPPRSFTAMVYMRFALNTATVFMPYLSRRNWLDPLFFLRPSIGLKLCLHSQFWSSSIYLAQQPRHRHMTFSTLSWTWLITRFRRKYR